MVAHDNLDLPVVDVELYRVLQDVKERLLEQLPVRADPLRDLVRLFDLNLEVPVLYGVVERSQKVQQQGAHGGRRALLE